MSKSLGAALAGALLLLPQSAVAQVNAIASAGNPQALVDLLELTGHNPKLGKDNQGDPKIELDLSDYSATIFFYGCDAKTHDDCDSLQLQAAFNRKQPWPASEAIKVAQKWRYAAVWLDDEGDPVVSFDIVTGDGIPAKVFLKSLADFGDTLDNVADMIFPDDGSQDTTKD